MVAEENARVNLVSRRFQDAAGDGFRDFIFRRHVLDSLSLLPYLDALVATAKTSRLTVVDVGCGGGYAPLDTQWRPCPRPSGRLPISATG